MSKFRLLWFGCFSFVFGCESPGADTSALPSVPPPMHSDQPPSDEATRAENAVGDSLQQQLQQLAGRYAPGMLSAGPIRRGVLSAGEKRDYQMVLEAGRCFRVVGRGGEGVEDLDLFLFDPNGVQVRQDLGRDNAPVLGVAAPICPERSAAYRVQVRMVEGAGTYGVQLFRSG